MKRIALFLFSFTLFTTFSQTTNAQSNKKSDAEIEGLRGKVISVKDKYYEEGTTFFGLIPFKKELGDEYKEFNKEGNIIFEDKPSYHGGNYRDREFTKYDERGNCIEQIDSNYENGYKYTYSSQYKYIYDEKGNYIEKNWYSNNRLVNKYYYKYNDSGYCIEELSIKPKDSTFWKDVYIRNENGKIIEWKRYNKSGDFDSKLVYEYNNEGKTIKEEYYDKDSIKEHQTLYIYNLEGDVIMEIRYDKNHKEYYAYIYTYKYDLNYNWIQKIEYYEDMSIKNITKREIKYYKD